LVTLGVAWFATDLSFLVSGIFRTAGDKKIKKQSSSNATAKLRRPQDSISNTTTTTTSAAIPASARHYYFNSTKATNCQQYIIHDNYGDGFGHQLMDIASGMVYHFLNDKNICYLAREPYPTDFILPEGEYRDKNIPPIGHDCWSCIDMYNELHRQWPNEKDSVPGIPITRFGNYWNNITTDCNEPIGSTKHNASCDQARMNVGQLWQTVVPMLAQQRNLTAPSVALHIRKGDFPREISDTYLDVMNQHFPGAKIDLFTEFAGESSEIVQQLKESHDIVSHIGGDALDTWLQMATAEVLFVHQSSYSLSAAVASRGVIFSQTQKPMSGRYDGQVFTCPTVGGWWISYGHGVTACPTDRLDKLTEKYSNF